MSKISDLLKDLDLLIGKYSIVSKLEEENKVLKIKLEWVKHCFQRAIELLDADDEEYINNLFKYYCLE